MTECAGNPTFSSDNWEDLRPAALSLSLTHSRIKWFDILKSKPLQDKALQLFSLFTKGHFIWYLASIKRVLSSLQAGSEFNRLSMMWAFVPSLLSMQRNASFGCDFISTVHAQILQLALLFQTHSKIEPLVMGNSVCKDAEYKVLESWLENNGVLSERRLSRFSDREDSDRPSKRAKGRSKFILFVILTIQLFL